MIRGAWTTQRSPAVYIVENAQWIDEISESMLADFTAVISRTDSMALITYRPEYRGALSRLAEGRTLTVAPLSGRETSELIAEQLGADDSLAGLAATIGERAVGNPFFVKEIVRDLAERGSCTVGAVHTRSTPPWRRSACRRPCTPSSRHASTGWTMRRSAPSTPPRSSERVAPQIS